MDDIQTEIYNLANEFCFNLEKYWNITLTEFDLEEISAAQKINETLTVFKDVLCEVIENNCSVTEPSIQAGSVVLTAQVNAFDLKTLLDNKDIIQTSLVVRIREVLVTTLTTQPTQAPTTRSALLTASDDTEGIPIAGWIAIIAASSFLLATVAVLVYKRYYSSDSYSFSSSQNFSATRVTGMFDLL